ncbi:hypothetical protein GXW82_04465 [Streptacidiphilus sp. 4-A2]|nr:hypothetical protein [Streptacidiphilus sp. 4-A2]
MSTEQVDASDQADPVQVARRLAQAARIDPHAGALLRTTVISTGPGRPDLFLATPPPGRRRLSWRVLATTWAPHWPPGRSRPRADRRGQWSEPGTSFRRWALTLQREALRPALAGQAPARWTRALAGPAATLTGAAPAAGPVPPGHPHPGAVRGGDPRRAGDPPPLFSCGPDTVLLAALVLAAAHRRGAGSALLVHLEGHGREPLTEPADPSGTVGWLTTPVPGAPGPRRQRRGAHPRPGRPGRRGVRLRSGARGPDGT